MLHRARADVADARHNSPSDRARHLNNTHKFKSKESKHTVSVISRRTIYKII